VGWAAFRAGFKVLSRFPLPSPLLDATTFIVLTQLMPHVSFSITDTTLKHNPLRIPLFLVHCFSHLRNLLHPHMRCLSLPGVPNVRRVSPSWHGDSFSHRVNRSPQRRTQPHPRSPHPYRPLTGHNGTPSTARHHHHQPPSPMQRRGRCAERARRERAASGQWATTAVTRVSAFSAMQMQHLSGQFGLSSYGCASGGAEPHANGPGEYSDGTGIAAGSSNNGRV
jgi:hypothetical protein